MTSQKINTIVGFVLSTLIVLAIYPMAANAQEMRSDWSNPEVLLSFPEGQKSNQLWVLTDRADTIYLWWPITDVVAEGETFVNSNSRTLHTQRINGGWRSPMDVMIWPDAGRLTSVVIDPEGTLHGFSGTDCVSYVSAQHDEAMSAHGWGERICLDQTGLANPSVVQSRDGTIYVMYAALENHSLRLIHSKDNGATWSAYVTVAEDPENFLQDPMMAIDDGGRLHAVWSVGLAPDAYPPIGVYYSRSDDGGQIWSVPVQLGGMDEGEPAITVYKDDVHVLWNGDAGKRGRYYRYSKDSGESWDDVEILSPPSALGGKGGLQRPPAIIVDNLGNVHALLHEQESLFYTSKIDQKWTEKQQLYNPGMMRANELFAIRLAITGGNELHAFYLLASNNQLNSNDLDNRSWALFHQFRKIDASPVPPNLWPTTTLEETPSKPDYEVQKENDTNGTEYTQNIKFTDDSSGLDSYNPAWAIYVGVTTVSVFILILVILFFIRQHR